MNKASDEILNLIEGLCRCAAGLHETEEMAKAAIELLQKQSVVQLSPVLVLVKNVLEENIAIKNQVNAIAIGDLTRIRNAVVMLES